MRRHNDSNFNNCAAVFCMEVAHVESELHGGAFVLRRMWSGTSGSGDDSEVSEESSVENDGS